MILKRGFLAALLLVLAAGCAWNTDRVYRIGLAAPFEGRYREIGYDVIYPARLALREHLNENPAVNYRVELVAYDDMGDPALARLQAQALAADETVLAVLGHWLPETTQAAIEIYQDAGLPLITLNAPEHAGGEMLFRLDTDIETQRRFLNTYLEAQGINGVLYLEPTAALDIVEQFTADNEVQHIGSYLWGTQQFRELTRTLDGEYWFVTGQAWPQDLAQGAVFREALIASDRFVPEPGPLAAAAYDAAHAALDAIKHAGTSGASTGEIEQTRQAVRDSLADSESIGITGPLVFNEDRIRQDAPLYLYSWHQDEIAPVLITRLR